MRTIFAVPAQIIAVAIFDVRGAACGRGALPPMPPRGLRSFMETILLDTVFDLPGMEASRRW